MKSVKFIVYPLTIILVVVLAYFLISSVRKPIDETAAIKRTEAAVIKKLNVIRDLQVAYQIQNGKYAGKWSELINFAKKGSLYIINISESTELNERGEEEVNVEVDTIGTVPVSDSLLRKYENNPNISYDDKSEYKKIIQEIDKIALIPGAKGKKFALYAGKIDKSGTKVDVFEVKDIFPINPDRGGTFDIEKRQEVDELIKETEPKIKQLNKNIAFYQKKMQPFINEMDPFVQKKKALEEKDPIENEEEIEELNTQIRAIEEKMEPFEKKWEKNNAKLEILENKLKMYQEKPLKIGSKEDVTTSGNWE